MEAAILHSLLCFHFVILIFDVQYHLRARVFSGVVLCVQAEAQQFPPTIFKHLMMTNVGRNM
jgi:hypothetical protein